MISSSWKKHAFRLVSGALLLATVGWLSGHFFAVVLIGLVLYSGWMLHNMFRLFRWLDGSDDDAPESLGVWSEIFERIYRLQKRNKRQQQQNESIIGEFLSMTHALPDATLVLDSNDTLTWFNDAAGRILGLRTPDDVGQPVTNLLRDPEFADWISVQEQVESHLYMANPVDTAMRLQVSAVQHREDQRLVILRDVTDIHNLERVRQDFIANVSHELRTPLTVLVGYLETLGEQGDQESAPAFERMREQAAQMQALLSDLLELSRLQSDRGSEKDEVVDVCAILMQLQKQAEEISQGSHEIHVTCQKHLNLFGNQKDLESAFRNLISNAIHYTPEHGTVRVAWAEDEEQLVFSVTDTGIGIPQRDIPRLTERFYRVGSDRSRHRGGTGLGLAIVKHVLNAHDAHLEIDSELGEGSTFRCVFPSIRRAGDQDDVSAPGVIARHRPCPDMESKRPSGAEVQSKP